jgi:membrane glycosyltransferase
MPAFMPQGKLRPRRIMFAVLAAFVYCLLLALLAAGLAPGGITPLTIAIMLCFAAAAPWTVLCFCNGAIGFALLFSRHWARAQAPRAPAAPIRLRTAILMTIRHEDPARAIARLRAVHDSLAATGQGDMFAYFLLSDSSDPAIAAAEQAAFAAWRATAPDPSRLHYRRRSGNRGFKAGNIMAFCDSAGDEYDLMLPLDADSLMAGPAILRLVRSMQEHPRLGILQGLVTGLPAATPFARLFQFGMRHGMRSHTSGLAWWSGDCGPYWGHNAVVRLAPFRAHCRLPRLPGRPAFGGDILSHDQVEAALMRRAGYEVRLMPIAGGSWEDNPPTLLDYLTRDLRWCQGNLQYARLLGWPGLHPVSRFQLLWAILMFAGVPAWIALAPLSIAAALVMPPLDAAHRAVLIGLWSMWLALWPAAKLAGYLHTATDRRRRARFGGGWRLAAGIAAETVFSLLHHAVVAFETTRFMARMAMGRAARWSPQRRDAHRVTWRAAAGALWPQTLFGVGVHGALLVLAPGLWPCSLPFTAGWLLCVPFAVATADPRVGAWFVARGLCAIPEEADPPPEFVALSPHPASRAEAPHPAMHGRRPAARIARAV